MSDGKKPFVNESGKSYLRQYGLLSEFQFSVVTPNNVIGGLVPPVTRTVGDPEFTLATLPTLTLNRTTDRVWLSGTVTYQGLSSETVVRYFIYRNAAITGTLVFNCSDVTSNPDEIITTSFSHVDFPVISTSVATPVNYFLTIVVLNGTATFSGPVTFTGSEMDANIG